MSSKARNRTEATRTSDWRMNCRISSFSSRMRAFVAATSSTVRTCWISIPSRSSLLEPRIIAR